MVKRHPLFHWPKQTALLGLLVLLCSCASGGRSTRLQFRQLLESGASDQALDFLQKESFYQEKKVALLKLLEVGMLLHSKGSYQGAIESFNQANDLARQLYTVSLSSKAQTLVVNDNVDIYYGESYELSLIHFYLTIDHFLLAQGQSGNERAFSLQAARAQLLAWDSFLKSLSPDRLGRAVFKNDLLAKVVGGLIHESLGSAQDRQVAGILYKDALDLLFKNYNLYPSFNQKAESFQKEFENFGPLSKEKVAQDYVEATPAQNDLREFLKNKIKDLKSRKNNKANVLVLFEEGLIPMKVGKTQYVGLTAALEDPNSSAQAKAVASIGKFALTLFAANKLNLLPKPNNWSPAGAYIGLNVASLAADSANIAFELPAIEDQAQRPSAKIIVSDQNGQEIKRQTLALVSPLGDIARQAIEEHSAAIYTRVGIRLATKHLTAVLSAYATYKALSKDGNNDFLASNLAVLQYAGLSKAIKESEKADTRYWSSLPRQIMATDLDLPLGVYHFKIQVTQDQNVKEYDLGQRDLSSKESAAHAAVNYRAY